jgi:hypothetical protein
MEGLRATLGADERRGNRGASPPPIASDRRTLQRKRRATLALCLNVIGRP